jgi:hypothetical protein
MPEFLSLSDVIRKQIQDSNSKRDSLLNIQSTLALTLNVAPSQRDRLDPESEVLTWGKSKWGIAKVTSKEQPDR